MATHNAPASLTRLCGRRRSFWVPVLPGPEEIEGSLKLRAYFNQTTAAVIGEAVSAWDVDAEVCDVREEDAR